MRKFTVLFFASLLTCAALAQDTDEDIGQEYTDAMIADSALPAPAQAVEEATANCKVWAVDEEVEDADLNAYLTNCVDEELSYQGYQPVAPRGQ